MRKQLRTADLYRQYALNKVSKIKNIKTYSMQVYRGVTMHDYLNVLVKFDDIVGIERDILIGPEHNTEKELIDFVKEVNKELKERNNGSSNEAQV